MPCSTTEKDSPRTGRRVERLKRAVQSARPGVCTDRALLWTEYIKSRAAKGQPTIIKMAGALSHVLEHKRIAIYPHEIIVGNFSSKRVGGSIYPELHGVTVMEDLFKFNRRQTSPCRYRAGRYAACWPSSPTGCFASWPSRPIGHRARNWPLSSASSRATTTSSTSPAGWPTWPRITASSSAEAWRALSKR